jgi:hypothetical protein
MQRLPVLLNFLESLKCAQNTLLKVIEKIHLIHPEKARSEACAARIRQELAAD